MIAATATFAVFKRQSSPTTIQVVTILTDLADIRPHDAIAPALPTYDEAGCALLPSGSLARSRASGFLKQFGVAEFVPVSERIVCGTPEELDSLAAAMAGLMMISNWRCDMAQATSNANKTEKTANRPVHTVRYGSVRAAICAQRGGQRQRQRARFTASRSTAPTRTAKEQTGRKAPSFGPKTYCFHGQSGGMKRIHGSPSSARQMQARRNSLYCLN